MWGERAFPFADGAAILDPMDQNSADHLLPDELAALMHFHADSGVGWLVEDDPIVDRHFQLGGLARLAE